MDLSQPGSQAQSNVSCLQGCGANHHQNDDNAPLAPSSSIFGRNSQTTNQASSLLDALSSDLNKLSFQERSKALEDLHCVGHGLEETPEMMEQALEDFDLVLKRDNYPIYDQAARQNRAHVEDRAFRLMFLRANMYEVPKAVNQLINHLHQKAKYFGEDKLGRDITLDDLSSDAIDVFLSGGFHVQADTDAAGRTIVCFITHLCSRWRIETLLRAYYYLMFHVLLPIECVQLKGLVMVHYINRSKPFGPIAASLNDKKSLKTFRNSVPVLYSGMHVCLMERTQQTWNEPLFGVVLKIWAEYIRARTRIHHGSDMEVQYHLKGYGIPLESFPVDTDGNLRAGILNLWFSKHLVEKGREDLMNFDFFGDLPIGIEEEEGSQSSGLIASSPQDHNESNGAFWAADVVPSVDRTAIQPRHHDILLGRGVRLMNHPGNIKFREFIIENYLDVYDKTPRNKRRKVTADVVRALKEKGIRFLERNEAGDWVESAAAEAEEKVGQLFRSRRKQLKISQMKR